MEHGPNAAPPSRIVSSHDCMLSRYYRDQYWMYSHAYTHTRGNRFLNNRVGSHARVLRSMTYDCEINASPMARGAAFPTERSRERRFVETRAFPSNKLNRHYI